MYCTRNVSDSVVWVGASDRRLALFENLFPIPRGVSYNSYLSLMKKPPCWTQRMLPSPDSIWKMSATA